MADNRVIPNATAAQVADVILGMGEVVWDRGLDMLRIGDGRTPGGKAIASADVMTALVHAGLAPAIADVAAARDTSVRRAGEAVSAAAAAQAVTNFCSTRIEGIGRYPVGTYFASAEVGTVRIYKRIAEAPGYQDMGDGAAPVARPDIAGLDLPLRAIGAAGLAADADAPQPTDQSAALHALFAGRSGQHVFPSQFDVTTLKGGYRIGRSTITIPRNVGFRGQGRDTRFFVGADASGTPLFGVNTKGDGQWIGPYPGIMSAEISRFYLNAQAAADAGKYPIMIELGGSASISNIQTIGIVQGVGQIRQYVDQVTVRRIIFTQPEDGSGRYYVAASWTGDGCVFDQLHSVLWFQGAQGDYATVPRSRTLWIRFKVGSTITNSINGDHLIEACEGIDTTSWHMEFGQIRVIGASAALRNHTSWRHGPKAPALNVPGIYLGNIPGLGNIALGVAAIYDYTRWQEQDFHGGFFDPSVPDIETEGGSQWWGHASIERAYRKQRLSALTAALGTKTGITTNWDNFNKYSHLASVDCDMMGGKLLIDQALPALPISTGGLNLDATMVSPIFGRFDGASGTYYYRVTYLYDTVRMIGLATDNEAVLTLTKGGAAAVIITDVPGRFMARIERGTASGQYSHYADVPLIVGNRLREHGDNIEGCEWRAVPQGGLPRPNVGSVTSFRIEPKVDDLTAVAYGRVTVSGRGTLVMPTAGSWAAGDLYLYHIPPGNRYLRMIGWRRMTTGAAHVLGIDWVEMWEENSPPVGSAAEIGSIGNAWNTQPIKRLGRTVLDTTSGKLVRAVGSNPEHRWVDAMGATVITPA